MNAIEDLVLPRFRAILGVLARGSEGGEELAWMRFAALAALGAEGADEAVGERVAGAAGALAERAGWFDPLAGPLRYVVAGLITASHDGIDAVLAEEERVHHLFRSGGIRRGGAYEILAILVLRILGRAAPITARQVEAMREIHAALRHHWWRSSRTDLPVCALLSSMGRAPIEVAIATDRLHAALREAGFAGGGRLEAATNLLCQAADLDLARGRMEALAVRLHGSVAAAPTADYAALALMASRCGEIAVAADDFRRALAALHGLPPVLTEQVDANVAAGLVAWHTLRGSTDAALRQQLAVTALLTHVPAMAMPMPGDALADPLPPYVLHTDAAQRGF
jgi:hypothetical protein